MLLSVVVFLFILSCVLAFYLSRLRAPRSVWLISIAAFGVRSLYVFLDELLGIYAGGGDQTGYEATFWFIAQQWRSGVVFAPLQYAASPGNDGYYMLVYSAVFSPAYAIFGRITVLPRLQMALVGTLVVVNIYLIGEHLYDHRAGIVAALLAAGFPYWIVLSGIIYRDMFIIFFLTALAYLLVRWQSGERNSLLFILLPVTAVLALSLRLENVIAIGALFATAAFLFIGRNPRGYVALFGTGVLALFAMYRRFGNRVLVKGLADQRLWLSRSNPGAYLSGFAYESFLELLVFAPVGALYFTLAPFPWHVIDLMALIAITQNIFIWYPVLVLSAIGLRDVLPAPAGVKMVIPLLSFSLAGIFGYGLVEGNIGPAIRHRSQFQFVFFVLAAIAISNRVRIHLSFAGRSGSAK